MRWLVAWSLKFRLLVVPIAAALMVLGVAQLRNMPVDVLPEFTPPYVEIQTEALGFSAPEVEELITVPLEGNLLNGVAGIDVIRSETVPGLTATTLLFEPGTDLLGARQLVQERLTQASALPGVTSPPAMLQPLSSASRVMMIGLSSKELSLIEVGLLARWTIRPRLLGVPGWRTWPCGASGNTSFRFKSTRSGCESTVSHSSRSSAPPGIRSLYRR